MILDKSEGKKFNFKIKAQNQKFHIGFELLVHIHIYMHIYTYINNLRIVKKKKASQNHVQIRDIITLWSREGASA